MFAEKERLCKKMSSCFRATRKQLGITQEEMAERLDIATRSYSDLEHGKCLCSTVVFLRYMRIQGKDALELLEELEALLLWDN